MIFNTSRCIFLLIALCVLAGCGDGGAAKAREEAALKEREVAKWNSYIAVSNSVEKQLIRALEQYLEFFPGETYAPPKGDMRLFERGIISVAPRERNAAMLEKAIANAGDEPRSDFDAMALEYVSSLRDLKNALEEVAKYYSEKAYVDDAHAGGKRLHAAILEAAGKFEKAEEAFRAAAVERDTRQLAESVAQMRKEGFVAQAAMLDMIVAGRNLLAELHRQNTDGSNVMRLDTAAYRPYYDALNLAYKEFEKQVTDKEQLRKEGIHVDSFLTRYATEMKSYAATILEYARAGKPVKIPPPGMPNEKMAAMYEKTAAADPVQETFASRLGSFTDRVNSARRR